MNTPMSEEKLKRYLSDNLQTLQNLTLPEGLAVLAAALTSVLIQTSDNIEVVSQILDDVHQSVRRDLTDNWPRRHLIINTQTKQ